MTWGKFWAYSRLIACVGGSLVLGQLFGFYVGLGVGLLVYSLIPTEIEYLDEIDDEEEEE